MNRERINLESIVGENLVTWEILVKTEDGSRWVFPSSKRIENWIEVDWYLRAIRKGIQTPIEYAKSWADGLW